VAMTALKFRAWLVTRPGITLYQTHLGALTDYFKASVRGGRGDTFTVTSAYVEGTSYGEDFFEEFPTWLAMFNIRSKQCFDAQGYISIQEYIAILDGVMQERKESNDAKESNKVWLKRRANSEGGKNAGKTTSDLGTALVSRMRAMAGIAPSKEGRATIVAVIAPILDSAVPAQIAVLNPLEFDMLTELQPQSLSSCILS